MPEAGTDRRMRPGCQWRRLRSVGLLAAVAVAVFLAAGCQPAEGDGTVTGERTITGGDPEAPAGAGRLEARPGGGGGNCSPGEHSLNLEQERAALVRIAEGDAGGARPFLLVLHPAGGNAGGTLWLFRAAWDEPGAVLLAPKSAGSTWSPDDVAFIDRALARVFERCRIDPGRTAIGGFSDGATYALSLGLVNGDLFDAVIAFSPGSILWEARTGKPAILIAHGTDDTVLPIEQTSGEIVPRLRDAGYSVTYRKFDGGHRVPRPLAADAVEWFLDR